MNFESQEKVIEYINSLVSSSLNKILYNLPVEKDIEIVIIDENKSFGYVVLYLPVQDENINLGYIPFVTDYSYCKFLFLQVQDEVYPLESKYIERLIPPQILQQLREQQTLNKTSEYKNYKETAQDIMYSKYSERRVEKIKNIIKNLKKSEKKLIPKSIKEKIQSKSEREKMPAHYFLMPKERKFPVKDPTTGKYHCGLIRAAITRAAQHKYENVERKARKLYEKHCKNKKTSSDILLELNYVNDEEYIANYLYKHSEYIDENTLSYILPHLINPYDLPQNNINLSPLLIYYTLNKTSNFLDYENNIKTAGAGTVLALLAGLGIMGALGFAGYKYMKHNEDYNNKHLQLFGKEASFIDKLVGSVFHSGDLLKHKFGIGEKEFELNLNNVLKNMKDPSKDIWDGIGKHVGFQVKEGGLYNIMSELKESGDRRFFEGLKNKDFNKIANAIKDTKGTHQYLTNIYEVNTEKLMKKLTENNAEGLKNSFKSLKAKMNEMNLSDEEKQYHFDKMNKILEHFKDPNNLNKATNFIENKKVKITDDIDPHVFIYDTSNVYYGMSMAKDILQNRTIRNRVKNILPQNAINDFPMISVKNIDNARQLHHFLEREGYYTEHEKKLQEIRMKKEEEERKKQKELQRKQQETTMKQEEKNKGKLVRLSELSLYQMKKILSNIYKEQGKNISPNKIKTEGIDIIIERYYNDPKYRHHFIRENVSKL